MIKTAHWNTWKNGGRTLGLGLLIIVLSTSLVRAQESSDAAMKAIVDQFADIRDMPYMCPYASPQGQGCGDSILWVAIEQNEKIIPYLLQRLGDSTHTPAPVPYYGGNYTVGDIAYTVLHALIWKIPTLELAEDPKKPEKRNGFWGYWKYTRRTNDNRVQFQHRVEEWYAQNKDSLVWIKSDNINICECYFAHPNGGHWEKQEFETMFRGQVLEVKNADSTSTQRLIKMEVLEVLQLDQTQETDARRLNQKRQFIWVLESTEMENPLEMGKSYRIKVKNLSDGHYLMEEEWIRELK